MVIGCALSTISTRWERIDWVSFSEIFDVVYLLHQKPVPVGKLPKNVVYVPLNNTGLTKSRNAGLAISNCDILFIADDDVKYIKEGVMKIVQRMNVMPEISVGLGVIQTPDGSLYKKYRIKNGLTTWRSLLSVSSIEFAVRPQNIRLEGIQFDERFGLGTNLPCGEESIFLRDCMNRGMKCSHFDIPFVIHPAESSTSSLTLAQFRARFLMFIRIYGFFIGFAFTSYFLVRAVLTFLGSYVRNRI